MFPKKNFTSFSLNTEYSVSEIFNTFLTKFLYSLKSWEKQYIVITFGASI